MKTPKRDYYYPADRERRRPHGTGILVALVTCVAFLVLVLVFQLI